MKKEIGIIALNDHYSGKRNIRENRRLFEDGTELKTSKSYLGSPGLKSEKMKSIKAYLYDLGLTPVAFQVDYETNVVFNHFQIGTYYENRDHMDDEIDDSSSSEDAVEKAVKAKMTGKRQNPPKQTKKIIDYQEFYHGFFSKRIPTYTVDKKLKDLIRNRTLDMGEFEITAVNYSTVIDDKALFGQFMANHKRFMDNKPFNSKIKFGYSLYITAKNGSEVNKIPADQKKQRKLAAFNIIKTVTEVFEKEILDKTTFYDFVA